MHRSHALASRGVTLRRYAPFPLVPAVPPVRTMLTRTMLTRTMLTRTMLMLAMLVAGACVPIGGPSLFAQETTPSQETDVSPGSPWAGHWHQWRGPFGNGSAAPSARPPVAWSEQENLLWKVPIAGDGSATPVVWGDRMFVVSAEATDRHAEQPPEPDPRALTRPPNVYYRFRVWCLQRDTGKVLWDKTACEVVPHEGLHPSHSYAAASPMTDGSHVYVSFGSRGIYCFDLDGTLVWQRQLGRMHTRRGWGEGTSPVVTDRLLLMNWDHEDDSFLYALDKQTGQTVWQVPRDEPTSWATPVVAYGTDRSQVIVAGTNRVRSYDLRDGSLIWECGGQTVNCIPSPFLHGDSVICMSGYRGAAAFAIPLNAQGDITGTDVPRWQHDRATPYVPSAVVAGDRLVFNSTNKPILTCLDMETGQPIIDRQRLPELGDLYASPISAGGRIYYVDREGTALVLEITDEARVLAVNQVDDPVDASPIALGNRLYLRGRSHVYCFQSAD